MDMSAEIYAVEFKLRLNPETANLSGAVHMRFIMPQISWQKHIQLTTWIFRS